MSAMDVSTRQTEPLSVKASIQGDEQLRRFSLPNPSFKSLHDDLIRIFSLPADASIVVRYKDDEDEFITISSDEELSSAVSISVSPTLRLHVHLLDSRALLSPSPPSLAGSANPSATPLTKSSQFPLTPANTSPMTPSSAQERLSQDSLASPIPQLRPQFGFAPLGPHPGHSGFNPHHRGPHAHHYGPHMHHGQHPFGARPIYFSQNLASSASKSDNSESDESSSSEQEGVPQDLMDQLRIQRENVTKAKREFEEKKQVFKDAKQKMWDLKKLIKQHRRERKDEMRDEKKQTNKFNRWEKKFERKFDKKFEKRGYNMPHEQPNDRRQKLKPTLLMARFVKDLTFTDGTEIAPNTHFVKSWRFRNESTQPWPQGSQLLFIGKNSDRLGAPETIPVNPIAPGEEADISIPMISPTKPGRYTAYFRLSDVNGKRFGQRVWAQINVVDSSSGDEAPLRPEELPGLFEHYAPKLQQLHAMGFTDNNLNIRVLKKFNGNLEISVKKLLDKNNKRISMLH